MDYDMAYGLYVGECYERIRTIFKKEKERLFLSYNGVSVPLKIQEQISILVACRFGGKHKVKISDTESIELSESSLCELHEMVNNRCEMLFNELKEKYLNGE